MTKPTEQEVAAISTGERVTQEQIDTLMAKVEYKFDVPEGTTSTFCHAFIDGFFLASGFSACVVAENFNAEIGQRYAKADAEAKARQKLWELEGYALKKKLDDVVYKREKLIKSTRSDFIVRTCEVEDHQYGYTVSLKLKDDTVIKAHGLNNVEASKNALKKFDEYFDQVVLPKLLNTQGDLNGWMQ